MEVGFYHPSRGYWQTTGQPPQSIRNGYPAGTIEVPLKPGGDYQWDGSQWISNPGAEPVPETIKLRQLILGMLGAQWITREEALGWSEKTLLPAVIMAMIATLPEAQRDAARITALTMGDVDRDNPMIAAAAVIILPEASEQERQATIDDAFRLWAKI